MAHKFKNLENARKWVFDEFTKMTKGKKITNAKRSKLLKMFWKRAEIKDARGEF